MGEFRTVTATSHRFRMWRSMRILKRFTSADLMATASSAKCSVDDYVRGLARCGYLRAAVTYQRGGGNRRAVWVLVRDTGPHPPRLRKDGSLFDINLPLGERHILPIDRSAGVSAGGEDGADAGVAGAVGRGMQTFVPGQGGQADRVQPGRDQPGAARVLQGRSARRSKGG